MAKRRTPIQPQEPINAGVAGVQLSGATISLPPMGGCGEGAFAYHLNVHLDAESSAALAALAESLDRQQMTLRNGRRVVERRQAALWLIEQLPQNAG